MGRQFAMVAMQIAGILSEVFSVWRVAGLYTQSEGLTNILCVARVPHE